MTANLSDYDISHAKLKNHLQTIDELIDESNSHFITARNKGIRNFLLSGTALAGLLFVGSGIAREYKNIQSSNSVYSAKIDTRIEGESLLIKGGLGVNIRRLTEIIGRLMSAPGQFRAPDSVIRHTQYHYKNNPKATLKWGGAALLTSLVVGLVTFIRSKSKLDKKTNQEIGNNLRGALKELKENPHLHEAEDYNDVVKQWSSKIKKASITEGLKDELLSNFAPARQ